MLPGPTGAGRGACRAARPDTVRCWGVGWETADRSTQTASCSVAAARATVVFPTPGGP